MTTPTPTIAAAVTLTESQLAALARLHHAIRERTAAAVLVGPAGSGKSTVLAQLEPLVAGQPHRLVDDAHLLSPQAVEEIAREVAGGRGPTVILAGQGRLLSLVARDTRLESAICLRAVVAPMRRQESRALATTILAGGEIAKPCATSDAFDTLHEIAGGMPRGVVSLARLARLLLEQEPTTPLDSMHIESLHRRLGLTAA